MDQVIARVVVVAAVVACAGAGAPAAQQASPDRSQETFRSSVDLVTIQASVRDKKGRPMKGLTPADFEVRDNGQVRPILSLRADLQSPLSLAILVDMSGSMEIGSKIAMARRAFEAVLSQLREGQDEVAVLSFDSSLHQRQDFTTDLSKVRAALSGFEPFGSTSLYDAIADTAKRLASRSATHKAIIVLTDGIDTSSTLTAPEVSGLASSIDVPVYIVATVPSVDHRAMMEAAERSESEAADLRDLAAWTGGQLVFASTFTETVMVSSHLVQDLRLQYVLAIEAVGVNEWRRLDVRVKHPSASVKARSGYFGG